MGISENFLVNTKSFDPIIEALISLSEQPETISETTLEKMGYDNPSDLLVLHVLRGLDIINQDKTPTDLYFKLVDPEQTKEAIAEGVIKGYKDLFLKNHNVHKMLPGELQEELKDYFDGKKTDLIIKYIANTFHKLVSYAGIQNVEEARDRILGDKMQEAGVEVDKETEEIKEEKLSEAEDTVKESANNGKPKPDYRDASEQKEISSRSVEEILFGDTRAPEDKSVSDSAEEDDEDILEASTSDENESDSDSGADIEISDDEAIIEEEESVADESEADDEATKEHATEEVTNTEENSSPPLSHDGGDNDDFDDEISLSKLDTSNKHVQKAVVRRSELQYKLGRYEEALESGEEIISYFENSDEDFLEKAVSKSVIRRVELVNKLDQDHKLLPALNEVIRRFSNSENPEYYEAASKAMLRKAELLEAKGYDEHDLLPLYNNIINRLELETDPDIREKVNKIFIKRLKLLNRADDKSELLKALEQSIERFGDSKRFRKYLEETMFRKAEILEEMNRNEEALEAYTTFLEEFGQPVDS